MSMEANQGHNPYGLIKTCSPRANRWSKSLLISGSLGNDSNPETPTWGAGDAPTGHHTFLTKA